ncbi:hypothetical protein [Bradyrhizobium sp. CCBAU 51753]|uniref:hypothetical protein n=1 Tax=Bradyrhizobium sp. CCBAU 51753 TaxID=1325100 RepID=UPI00188D44B1|nr:hypothetical protein [Bradyrhizobium sp. CCBAU 51753]QOZ23291.1 hypothetical protein XH93_06235 [Bradyrhizobium sp. CCBAU 51753]
MEEHPLLQVVANWPGRGPTQLAFEALGFSVHRAWQDRMRQYCSGQQADLLDRYWDEVAVETMQSLGRGSSDERSFVIEPKYRSAFLDDLFAARDFVEPKFRYPPLIKCLFEHFKKLWYDAQFRDGENAFFSRLLQAEVERFGIRATGWSGTRGAVIPFLETSCAELNFEPRGRRWRKRAGDLVFEIGADLGYNQFRDRSPLKFRIYNARQPKYVFDLWSSVMDRLVPGVERYSPGRTVDQYLLGVKAYIGLFNLIAESLASSPASPERKIGQEARS